MRLACVYVPQLALQAALRRSPEARESPAVRDLLGRAGEEQAARHRARRRGAQRRGASRHDRRAGLGDLPRPAALHRDGGRRRGGRGGIGRRRLRLRAARGARTASGSISPPTISAGSTRRETGDRAGGAGARRAARVRRAGGARLHQGERAGGDARARAGGGAGGARPARATFLAPLPVHFFTDDAELARRSGAGGRAPPARWRRCRRARSRCASARPARRWRGSRAAKTTNRFCRSCRPTRWKRRSSSTTPSTSSSRSPSCCAGSGRSRARAAGRPQPGLRRADAAPHARSRAASTCARSRSRRRRARRRRWSSWPGWIWRAGRPRPRWSACTSSRSPRGCAPPSSTSCARRAGPQPAGRHAGAARRAGGAGERRHAGGRRQLARGGDRGDGVSARADLGRSARHPATAQLVEEPGSASATAGRPRRSRC